jgi:hypothetical protein
MLPSLLLLKIYGTAMVLTGFSGEEGAGATVTVPGEGSELVLSAQTSVNDQSIILGDGSRFVYAHGEHQSLTELEQGQASLMRHDFEQLSHGAQPGADTEQLAHSAQSGADTAAAKISTSGIAAWLLGGLGIATVAGVAASGGSSNVSNADIAQTSDLTIQGDVALGPVQDGSTMVYAYDKDGVLLGSTKVVGGKYTILAKGKGEYTGLVYVIASDNNDTGSSAGTNYKSEATGTDVDMVEQTAAVGVKYVGTALTINVTPATQLSTLKMGVDLSDVVAADSAAVKTAITEQAQEANLTILKATQINAAFSTFFAVGNILTDLVSTVYDATPNAYGKALGNIDVLQVAQDNSLVALDKYITIDADIDAGYVVTWNTATDKTLTDALKDAKISEISVETVKVLNAEVLKALTETQITEFTKKQVEALTTEQIKELSPKQIATLTAAEQVVALSIDQLMALSADQIFALTSDQITALQNAHLPVPIALKGVTLSNDTGSSVPDCITKDASQIIYATLSSALETGDKLWATLDGTNWVDASISSNNISISGTTVSWTTTLNSGTNAVQFRVDKTVGQTVYKEPVLSQPVMLDTTPPRHHSEHYRYN